MALPPVRPGLLIALAVVALLAAVWLRESLGMEALAEGRAQLLALRAAAPWGAALGFLAAYAVLVALSLPGATLASLTGGLLFGLWPGVALNVAGASAGAIALFWAVRQGAGRALSARLAAHPKSRAVMAALARHEWRLLLVMRLLPVVPFWLANLLPAVTGVALHRFAVTTVVGILPGALLLTWIGAGLGAVLDQGAVPDLSLLRDPAVWGGALSLAALVGLPLLRRGRR